MLVDERTPRNCDECVGYGHALQGGSCQLPGDELNFHSFAPATESKDHPPGANVNLDNGLGNSSFWQYNIPSGFNHLMNKMTHVKINQDAKRTLQSVQNNMVWWSIIIKSLGFMFSWEDIFYTAHILLYLIMSCVLHIVIQ